MNIKEQLVEISKNYNAKQFTKFIRSKQELNNYCLTHMETYNCETIVESMYCIIHDLSPTMCPCGKKALFNSFYKGYRKFCSSTCPEKGNTHSKKIENMWKDEVKLKTMVEKVKKTNLERYGYEQASKSNIVKEKTKQTNLERYGYEHTTQVPEIIERMKTTNKEKYGVEYPFQSDEIRKKAEESFVENHGFKNNMRFARNAFLEQNDGLNPFQVLHIQEKIKDILVENYGVDHPLKSDDIKKKAVNTLLANHGVVNQNHLHIPKDLYQILQNKELFIKLMDEMSLTDISKTYGVTRSLITRYHDKYELNIITKRVRSSYETEIAKILDDNNIIYKRNYNKLCYPLQVDFYIPEYNLAIEFNGLYWHSVSSGKKTKDYHASKTKQCMAQGIQLITIFEDEWLNRPKVVIGKILRLCNKSKTKTIGARKITITGVNDKSNVKTFLEQHHFQGKTEGISIALECRFNGELLAVATFRKLSNNTYDMTRFCIDVNYSIPGLMSKIIKFVKMNYSEINEIVTIADLRWSTGDVYKKTGFTESGYIKPDYQYTDYVTREHKFNFRKNRIKTRFGIDITNKTENELTTELGYDRIWDCGKLKFSLKI